MRKKETLNLGWLQKTFRVHSDTIKLYKLLEFHSTRKGISKDNLFEILVNKSLDFIETHGLKFENKEMDGAKIVKGFTMTQDTLDRLQPVFQEYKKLGVFNGELLEILIELYTLNSLSKDELAESNINLKYVDERKFYFG